MATTTSNFSWPIPQSTDLVKDGATAIASLGSGIDTSMADLKGGTTGQVLKKNSNTDMDFVWSADSAGMTNPMTTTGDTIYSSSGSTPARLGIGSTGQVLTVSGGLPVWAAAPGGSWSQAATGSLSGSSVNITGLSGQKYYVGLIGWSGTGSEYVQVRFNNDSATNYRRGDSDSAVSELYVIGASTQPAANTFSNGFFVDMANTSMAGKPLMSVTPKSTNGSVGGFYMSSNTITQINLIISGGTFDAGTYYVWSFA